MAGREKEEGNWWGAVGEASSVGHLPEYEISAGRNELIKGSGPADLGSFLVNLGFRKFSTASTSQGSS